MGASDNKLFYAINYFNKELNRFYDSSELEQLLHLTFYYCFQLSRIDLTLRREESLSATDFDKIVKVVDELKMSKPLAQIIGEWEFYGVPLKVNEHTLIPRPETEELVKLIITENEHKDSLSILDIGTGTGCIALALKKEIPHANVFAYDISKDALRVATSNAEQNSLNVNFNEIDILNWETQNIIEKFDVIVSNPPYITMDEKKIMHKNVLDYEPHLALFVENDNPLLFYSTIANFSLIHLIEKGSLYFEINENYGEGVVNLLGQKSFNNIELIKDINDKDRIVKCETK